MLTIRFTPNGKAPIILGDDPNAIYVSGYTRDGSSIEQVVQLLRADQIQIYDRGNFSTRITFRASRAFTSPAANLTFLHTHPESLVGVGQLLISVTGPFYQQWRLPRAKVKIRSPLPRGTHLFIDYEILGGKFDNQNSNP